MNVAAFKIQTFIAADGMQVGYRTIGMGRGLILVHGALQSSLNFTDLAGFLSADFTVCILERRGRGISPSVNIADDLYTLANDVLSLAAVTGAKYIFGLSSGAIISLKAAVTKPVFEKIALYEPPLPLEDNPIINLAEKYERAIARQNLGRACIEILKGTADSSLLAMLPTFITAPLFNMMMKLQKRTDNELPLREIVPTFRYDIMVIKQSEALITQAKDLEGEVLLLGGTKSQLFLKHALDRLQQSLPNAQRVVLKHLGHVAPDNSERPQIVATRLISFFSSPFTGS